MFLGVCSGCRIVMVFWPLAARAEMRGSFARITLFCGDSIDVRVRSMFYAGDLDFGLPMHCVSPKKRSIACDVPAPAKMRN